MTTSFEHDSPHLAATYDRISDHQLASGKRLVERLEVGEGSRVLDLGSGTGRLTQWIAERVGPSGAVTGLDPLPERVALAQRRAPGLRFEVGRAEDLGAFPAASFDVVCMSAVFHWVEDKARALGEIRRVLAPGGRVGLTTMPRDLIGKSTIAGVVVGVLVKEPYASAVDLSRLALASRGETVSQLLALVVEAGFDVRELHVVERRRSHASGADALDFLEASAFGNFLRIAPEPLRPALRADLERAFDARREEGAIVLRDWGTVLVATSPGAA